jgi:hypothetical protein
MNEDVSKMGCEAFQSHLPELIGSGENVADHPHLRRCELCRALLADLETIAEAARQLFPIEEPPDHLWEHIESAIKNEEAVKGGNGPSISMHGSGSPELE